MEGGCLNQEQKGVESREEGLCGHAGRVVDMEARSSLYGKYGKVCKPPRDAFPQLIHFTALPVRADTCRSSEGVVEAARDDR